MDQLWKQFEALGTGSRSNVFFKAHLKLTLLYVFIIAIIIFGFSIFLYENIARNLRDASDDDFAGAGPRQHFVDNTLGSVQNEILLADLFILAVSAAISYILAGKTLRPIQQSVEAQKTFAANASHELRTPLAVMKNDIEVYKRTPHASKESTAAVMESNLEEIGRMSSIVENLLVLARSDNQTAPAFTDIQLATVVTHTAEKMKPLATGKHVTLEYADMATLKIRGAANALERVILNILQNSLDHTQAGGSIRVTLTKEGSDALLRVTDTGSGIAVKDLPHVFTRFYKGDSAHGTGLGLSIVKELVEQHRGNMSIESSVGKGTAVSIRLPLA